MQNKECNLFDCVYIHFKIKLKKTRQWCIWERGKGGDFFSIRGASRMLEIFYSIGHIIYSVFDDGLTCDNAISYKF